MDTTTPATAPATPVTVSDILDRYQRECLPRLAPSTQREYVRHLKVLRSEFGHYIAADLKPKDVAPFLQVPQGKKGAVMRVRQLAVLSAAFTQAVSFWFLLPSNILRDVKRPHFKPRDRLISDEEFGAIKALAPKRVQLAMMLALLTGQRQGDIIRFKWSDIRDMAVHVRQAKTGKRLAIEINPELERVLDDCWQLKGSGSTGGAYILPTRTGKPYTSEGFRACWQRVHRAWLRHDQEPLHFHDIRALAATKCATPEIAMRLLGHSTLAMTARVYRRGVERVPALQL